MRHRLPKLLEDVRAAAANILLYTNGMDEEAYLDNQVVRRAVEREFEIIGEALRRVSVEFPSVAEQIASTPQIIAFRNVLAHGYDAVEDAVVWSIVDKRLRQLLREVEALASQEQSS